MEYNTSFANDSFELSAAQIDLVSGGEGKTADFSQVTGSSSAYTPPPKCNTWLAMLPGSIGCANTVRR